jgi:hypothetical protein
VEALQPLFREQSHQPEVTPRLLVTAESAASRFLDGRAEQERGLKARPDLDQETEWGFQGLAFWSRPSGGTGWLFGDR